MQWPTGWGKCRNMSDAAEAGTRIADHNVVATYESPDDARAALVMLERHGVEAGDIELFGPGIDKAREPIINDELREADLAVTDAMARRIAPTSLVLGVVLAAVGAVAGWFAFHHVVGVLMGGVGGAVVGAVFGLLYGGYTGLGADEGWGETFASPGGQTSVAVHSADQAEVEVALEALKGTDAKRLAVYGRDRQLRDVA